MTMKPEQGTDPGPGNEPVELDQSRKDRMRERLLASATGEMAVIRAPEQDWQDFLPGVQVKMLYQDAEQGIQTALWRMQPGARIPPHPHGKDEECYVIEGMLVHRGTEYHAGDYMRAPAGSRHDSVSSPEGAVMLIRGDAISWRQRLLLRTALTLGR